MEQEFNTRYPQYRYFNVFPGAPVTLLYRCLWLTRESFAGLVRSELFTLDAFPIPLRWVVSLGLKTMGVAPADYANVPVYVSII